MIVIFDVCGVPIVKRRAPRDERKRGVRPLDGMAIAARARMANATNVCTRVVAVSLVLGANGCRATPPPVKRGSSAPAGQAWLTMSEARAAKIEVDTVSVRWLDDVATTSGRVALDETRAAHVYSPMAGTVVCVDAEPGDRVTRGQRLAVIESRAASRDDRTARSTVVAPIDGEIVTRRLSPGAEVAAPDSGAPAIELFTIGAADRVWVVADLGDTERTSVKPGTPAVALLASDAEHPYAGVIDRVDARPGPSSHTGTFRFLVENEARNLKPDGYLTVRVTLDKHPKLTIPRSSVNSFAGATVVFEELKAPAGQRRFARTPVMIEDVGSREWVAVDHGLREGQRVVSSGAEALTERL